MNVLAIRSRHIVVSVAGMLACSAASARAQRTSTVGDSISSASVPSSVLPNAAPSMHAMRERGVSIGVLDADSLQAANAADLSDLLASRFPGVVVQRSSGTTGTGSSIRIRGISSLRLSGDPLLVVDGVRVDGATSDMLMNVGGQAPSRLDDLDPEEIQRIDVLRGPSSAALYGGDASAGVIVVTTRHGYDGRAIWRAHTEFGAVNETSTYPANFYRPGINTFSNDSVACPLSAQADGSCTPGALTQWNPIERATPFRTGLQQRAGLSVSGGRGGRTYFISGDFDHEAGVYTNNSRRRVNLRANIASRIGEKLDLTLSTGYVNGALTLPMNDASDIGILFSGLAGSALDDSVRRGYRTAPPESLLSLAASDGLHRLTTGLTAVWQPSAWMRWTTTIGMDLVHQSGREALVGLDAFGGLATYGMHTDGTEHSHALTIHSGLAANSPIASSIQAQSSAGIEYESARTRDEWRDVPDAPSSRQTVVPSFWSAEAATVGGYMQWHVAWRDALFATAAVRGDKRTGQVGTFTLHPSVDLSWLVTNEPFFPDSKWLHTLRLRAAFGSTARFAPTVTGGGTVVSANQPSEWYGFLYRILATKPERTREVEAGLDATLFGDRLALSVTHYDRTTSGLMILQAVPPTFGSGSALTGVGSMRNHGDELSLRAALAHARPVTWSIALAGARNINTFVTGDAGTAYVLQGFGPSQVSEMQLIRPGYPAAGYWARPIVSYKDKNGDGIISSANCSSDPSAPVDPACEIQLGELAFLGSAIPTRELSLSSDLTIVGRVTLSALLDHQGGFSRFDGTRQTRCYAYRTCRAAEDPTAPLADQAAVAASLIGSDAGYIEDASFWKLREVDASVTLPAGWARRLAVHELRVTLAAHNLATWTHYRGFDPEVNAFAADPLLSADWFTQPMVRDVTARVDATW